MKNNYRVFASIFFLFLITFLQMLQESAHAAYVLPYPSVMPGSRFYRVSRILDEIKRYWHWGNLTSYRYEMGQSDKALIEAKTLFEYRQYQLALAALDRSNTALLRVPETLIRADREGKNIQQYIREFAEAMDEHKRILSAIIGEVPGEYTWSPENSDPKPLYLH